MNKRRAKGDGSVYRRKDGRVVGEWKDANGHTRYMTSTKMSKAEMSKAVRRKLQDRDEGIVVDSGGLALEYKFHPTPMVPPPIGRKRSRHARRLPACALSHADSIL